MNAIDYSGTDESNRSLLESESTYLIPVSDVEASPPRPLQLISNRSEEDLEVSSSLSRSLRTKTHSEDSGQRKRIAQRTETILDEMEGGKVNPVHVQQRKMKKAVRRSSTEQPPDMTRQETHVPSPHTDKSKTVEAEMLKLNLSPDDEIRTKAAVMVQSLWRGWRTRNRDEHVRRLLQRLRTRRSEDHIRYLRSELDRVVQMYEEEKKLRNLQFEAIKYLWQEVKGLQKWKSEVTGESGVNGKLQERTVRSSQDRTGQLTQQVDQLEEAVSTLTNYVFQGCVTGTGSSDGVSVSPASGADTLKSTAWECVECLPAEASAGPGTPPCPPRLAMRPLSDSSVLIWWESPEDTTGLIGYRLYVDDMPKAMLASTNTSARLDGLSSAEPHALYVRTVSTLGESGNSETLVVRRTRSNADVKPASPDSKPPVHRPASESDGTPPPSPHTPKIMQSRTRDLQPSSPDSEDSNKENLSEPSPGQRKNRASLERLYQIKVMPDKPEHVKRKQDDDTHSRSLSEPTASELPPAAAPVRTVKRARSISLSESVAPDEDPDIPDMGAMKKSSSSGCVARRSMRSCSPNPSDSLPAKASSKEQLLKVQQSITDKSQLQDDDDGRKVTIRRSSSLKTTPDRYRLSPTGQMARLRRDSGGSDRASPVIQRDSSPEPADNDVEPSLMRSSSLKAKVNLEESQLSGLRRSSSLKGEYNINILPNRDMAFGSEEPRTSPTQSPVQPIVKEKNQEKGKSKSTGGLLSKFKSKK